MATRPITGPGYPPGNPPEVVTEEPAIPDANTNPEGFWQLFRDFLIESKKILNLGAPLAGRSMVLAVRLFLVRAMLAEKDPLLLVKLAGISQIDHVIFSFLYKSLRGVSPLIRGVPNTEKERVGVVFRHCLFFSSALMLPVGLLCLSAPTIFQLMEQPEAVISNSGSYFRYMFFAYFLDILYRVQGRTLVGLEITMPPLITDIVEAIVHLFFTYIFVNGKLGFSEMGVEAYALGYALAAFLTLTTNTIYLFSQDDLKEYKLFKNLNHFSWDEFKKVKKNCLMPGIGGIIEQISQSMIVFFCGLSSDRTSALIGAEIAKAYSLVIGYAAISIAQACAILIPKIKKEDELARAKIGYTTYGLNTIFSYSGLLFLLAFSDVFVGFFLENNAAHKNNIEVAKQFLLIRGVLEIFNSAITTGACALMGFSSDTAFPMYVSAGIFIVNLMAASLAQFYFQTQASTMYATQIIGYFFAALAIYDRWYHRKQTEKSVINSGVSYAARLFSRKPPSQTVVPSAAASQV